MNLILRLSFICLSFITLSACERAAQLSDELDIRFGDYTPLDMAMCAGMYRDIEVDEMADTATVATYEAARIVYGWTTTETEERIVKNQHDFAQFDLWSEEKSDRCGEMMPLMDRIYARKNAERK